MLSSCFIPAEIRSPFDGRRVARVHRADEAQASEAAGKALEAFPEVRRLISQQRSEILLRLRDGVAARRGEIEAAMVAESGKPVQHVRMELDDRFTGEGLAISSVLADNLVFYDGANRCSVLQIDNRATGGGDFVQLYSRRLGERTLSFRAAGDERFEDEATGSVWNVKGRCVEGQLQGEQLAAVPHYNKIFWCVWGDFFPETAVWESREGEVAS